MGRELTSLVLLRHGATVWTDEDRFTGLRDVPLSPAGARQARHAGSLIRESALEPCAVFSSRLVRASRTAELVVAELGLDESCVTVTPQLDERGYGALEGHRKSEIAAAFGPEQCGRWRRGTDVRPPRMSDVREGLGHRALPACAPRLRGIYGESLLEVRARVVTFLTGTIIPLLAEAGTVLVVSHSNALRMLIQHIEGISDRGAESLSVPVGEPLAFPFDPGSAALRPCGVRLRDASRRAEPTAPHPADTSGRYVARAE